MTKEISTHQQIMSLIPKPEQPKTDSPAVKLRKKHMRVTGDKGSLLKDFTKLLKTHNYHDIDKVLSWLAKQPESVRTLPSGIFASRFGSLQSQMNQALDSYPVTHAAMRVQEHLEEAGETASNELIQHCLDHYVRFSQWVTEQAEPVAKTINDYLPPSSQFAYLWFAKLLPSRYSDKFRKFEYNHPKFQQFLHGIAQQSGETRAFVKLMNRFNDTHGTATET